jgi:Bacterial transglutaminase-like N-terminal region
VLRQRFSYTYGAPVRDLDHRLVVVLPRRHGDQRRRHSITVSAADARTTHRRDAPATRLPDLACHWVQ